MKRKIILTAVLLLSLIIGQTTAFAVDKPKYSEKPTIGVEASKNAKGNYIIQFQPDVKSNSVIYTSEDTPSFMQVLCSINLTDVGRVSGYADTTASKVVDEIGYTLYFQKWNGYDWVDISSVKNSAKNEIDLCGYHFKSVDRNKYYRVRAEHYFIENGVRQTSSSTSGFLLVE